LEEKLEEKPKEKKARIEVLVTHSEIEYALRYLDSYGQGRITPLFALASVDKENRRVQATTFSACRDYINDAMLKCKNSKFSYHGYNDTYPPLDFNTLRLLVSPGIEIKDKEVVKNFSKRLLFAKRILNIYELLGEFERRSLMTRVNYITKTGKKISVWLFTGPGEWMRTSHLTSLVTLILRVLLRTNIRIDREIKNVDDVNNFFKAVTEEKGNSSLGSDLSYIQQYKKFELLIKNFKSIFDNLDDSHLFPADFKNNWHSSGGINSLMCHITYLPELDERFKKLCKEKGY
jgi:hypothetical protein